MKLLSANALNVNCSLYLESPMVKENPFPTVNADACIVPRGCSLETKNSQKTLVNQPWTLTLTFSV